MRTTKKTRPDHYSFTDSQQIKLYFVTIILNNTIKITIRGIWSSVIRAQHTLVLLPLLLCV